MDLILERGTSVVAVEIKASATVTASDTLPMRELREALGKRFKLGIVATLGRTADVLDRSICVVPLGSLLGVGRR